MQKLISVIVPIYNVKIYLEKCIDTIICQTYKNIEIILVDDGSTDGSSLVCDSYEKKDNRIKVIHKKNGGLSSARNAGLDICKGEYITFIDSDDYIERDYIETLINIISTNDADISIVNRFEVKDGKIIKPNYYFPLKKENINSKELIEMFSLDILPHEAWGKLYKSKIFDKARYKDGLKVFEDIEFILRVLAKNELKTNCDTSKYLYNYRFREDSIMNEKFNKFWNEEILFYLDMYRNIENETVKESLAYCISKKSLRNLKVVLNHYDEKSIFYDTINLLSNSLKEIKIKYKLIKGKKNKIKIILIKDFKFFLKLIYKYKNLRKKLCNKKFINYLKVQRKKNEPLSIIFNGPVTGNLGDHAILFAEENYLNKQGKNSISISAKEMNIFFNTQMYKKIQPNDIVYITGGGNIGTLWRNEQDRINLILKTFKENQIIIFPQTIYYSQDEFGKMCLEIDKKFFNECKNLKVYCRDRKSYEFAKSILNVNCELKKDMALTLNYKNAKYKRKGVIFCFRNDKEKILSKETEKLFIDKIKKENPNDKINFIDTLKTNRKEYSYKQAKKEFNKIIKQFQSAKLVVTDRLHGMILSVVTNTPCIAFNNSSGKVKGVYETMDKTEKEIVKFIEKNKE